MQPPVFIITGAMASGKSTVSMALAKRFDRSACVEGDAFLRMMVSGRAHMGPVLGPEALAQLELRHRLATDAVRRFAESGFTVVYEDILVGGHLLSAIERLADLNPRVVVLAPSVAVLAERDRQRDKQGYSTEFPPHVLADALVEQSAGIGTWIDSSGMEVDEVVAAILRAPPDRVAGQGR
jgi:cytidylate kinase